MGLTLEASTVNNALVDWYWGKAGTPQTSNIVTAISSAKIKPDNARACDLLLARIQEGLLSKRIEWLNNTCGIDQYAIEQGIREFKERSLPQIEEGIEQAQRKMEPHGTQQFQTFFAQHHEMPANVAKAINYAERVRGNLVENTEQGGWFVEYTKEWIEDLGSLYGYLKTIELEESERDLCARLLEPNISEAELIKVVAHTLSSSSNEIGITASNKPS